LRPELTKKLTQFEFQQNYWLKEELTSFCRAQNLPTSGGKLELSERIEQFLSSGKVVKPVVKHKTHSTMPKTFSREMVIGKGWHCSQDLRSFFETEIGASFHFNGVMRDFIKNESGKTLQDAIDAYKTDLASGVVKEIDKQFEYNRHMRDFYKNHPGATLKEAIKAWKELKYRRAD
jgi:hypothetical protein